MYNNEMIELLTETTESIPTVEGVEYADYIKNNFLNSFLSEDYDSIVECISKLCLANSVDEAMVIEALINIQTSNCGSITKLDAMREVVDIFAESVKKDYVNEDAVMLEFAGNPEKNKILKKLMVEMEKALDGYYKEIDVTVDAMDEIFNIVAKEAKKGDKCNAKAAALAARGVYHKIEKLMESKDHIDETRQYNHIFIELRKICKSFSVKFSDIAMEDKKEFDKKLEAACRKVTVNKKFESWIPTDDSNVNNSTKIRQLNENLAVLHIDSKDAVDAIVNYLRPVYDFGYNSIMGYIGNINYIRKILGLEREDTIFYKILNKVIKTKKD